MTLNALLDLLSQRGIDITAEEGRLRYRAPKGALTSELAAELTARKDELLARLGEGEDESEERYPLSHNQLTMWFMQQIAPESAAHNIMTASRIRSAVDVSLMRRNIRTLMERHPILRTTYTVQDGRPMQRIHRHMPIPFDLVDAGEWSRQLLDERLAAEAHRPFDLEQGPVFRIVLFMRTPQDYVILQSLHHIAFDGWSNSVLTTDLYALYAAALDPARKPPEPPRQRYVDFVHWQQEMLAGDDGRRLRSYWHEQLAGCVTTLDFPTDKPRPPLQSYRGAAVPFALSQEVSGQIQQLARREGVTLFMVLLTALQAVLYRYSGQQDLCIGTMTAGRGRPEFDGVVGYFVNPVVLRANLSGRPTFLDLLAQARRVVLGAIEHQDYPFSLLVEELLTERDPSRSPLFQVMFVLNRNQWFGRRRTSNSDAGAGEEGVSPFGIASAGETGMEIDLHGLVLESYPLKREVTQFDIMLEALDTGDSVSGLLQYNTDLFEAATMERFARHYQQMLVALVANPAQRVAAVELLNAAEHRQILNEWNGTIHPLPQYGVQHLFEVQAARTPGAIAVVAGNDQLTYEQLDRRANQLAHRLRELEVGTDTLVGLCVERSIEMVVGLLGILKAGGAYLPLDPSYPTERLAFMLSDAQVRVIVSQNHLLDILPPHQARTLCLDSERAYLATLSTDAPTCMVRSDDLAYAIYTSGSTGSPKAVLVTHGSVTNFLQSMREQPGLVSTDVLAAVTTLSFDIAALEIFLPLVVGARTVVLSREIATDGIRLLQALDQSHATVMQATPATWRLLLDAGWEGTPKLKIICGGEALPHDLADRLGERGASLWNLYGPSETTIWSTLFKVERSEGVYIGRPIANTQVYVLDADLKPLPIGVPGELYIAGAGLARGYLHRPALTAERFIPDPFGGMPGARMYKTGDLVRFQADGNIEYLRRVDHQIKLRGYRIELDEIAAVLVQHPAVDKAVVVLREDGPVGPQIVAFLVASPGQTPDSRELLAFLRTKLPAYMLPSACVTLDQLPLTLNNKVDRQVLLKCEYVSARSETIHLAPRTPTEEILASIWSEVLGQPLIGIHDNFFAMGGQSLLATQVISRIQERFGKQLPVRVLFEAPTIAELAYKVDQATQEDQLTSPVSSGPMTRTKEVPLSLAQERLWFLEQMAPGTASYNISVATHMQGALDVATFNACLSDVVARHETLRTAFTTVAGQPVQLIAPSGHVCISVTDLQDLPEEFREAEALRQAGDDAEAPFNLAQSPLLRCRFWRLDAANHIALLVVHHLVADGWSLGVLWRDLATLYKARVSGVSATLPDPSLQYADYDAWRRKNLRGIALDEHLQYWQQKLAGAPRLIELPTDYPRPPVQTMRGAVRPLHLDQHLLASLRSLGQQEDATLFMVLLTAFQILIARYTGLDDVAIGTPIANRTRVEAEALIGFFANTLVMRTDLSGEPIVREALRRVRLMALDAYAHQDLPFERIVEAIHPARDLSYSPVVQVFFILQNLPPVVQDLPGIRMRLVELEQRTAKFDLTLSLAEHDGELSGSVEYSTDLFESATIDRLIGHYEQVLRSMTEQPSQPITTLPLLTSAEKRQLQGWNDTHAPLRMESTISAAFEAQVRRTPDATALIGDAGWYSFAELNCRANQLAHYLRRNGIAPEMVVGICLERSIDLVVGMLAILKAGGTYLPLDVSLPAERLAWMLTDARPAMVVTTRDYLSRLPTNMERVVLLDADGALIEAAPDRPNPPNPIDPEGIAYLLYTSGSTGTPKGVLGTHRGLLNRCAWQWQAYPFSAGEVCCAKTALGFVDAAAELFAPLLAGVPVLLIPEAALLNPPALLDLLGRHMVSRLILVPSLLRLLLEQPNLAVRLPSLRLWVSSGEALPAQLATRFTEQLPEARLLNLYGSTEVAADTTYYDCSEGVPESGIVPIGRPLANTEIHLLDHRLQPVPIGVSGELFVGGVGLAGGYLNRPDLTAERFVPHPFNQTPGARLYRTGDRARWRVDGVVEYLGRDDGQVKVRGQRVEIGEVEAALLSHPAVAAAAVIPQHGPLGDLHLVAHVVPRREALDGGMLRHYLRERLPSAMVPSDYLLAATLPLSSSGKIDRLALKSRPQQTPTRTAYLAPSDVEERRLVAIWESMLGIHPIGVRDDFFNLGGHSLQAVRLVEQIADEFKLRLPLGVIYEQPTIQRLAELLREGVGTGVTVPPIMLQLGGALPPLLCVSTWPGVAGQYRILAEYLGSEQPVHVLQLPTDLKAPADASIENAAELYVRQVLAFQPRGPYYLCGYSAAGVLAFEIARLLEEQGMEVRSLVLLDVVCPGVQGRPWRWSGSLPLVRLRTWWSIWRTCAMHDGQRFAAAKTRNVAMYGRRAMARCLNSRRVRLPDRSIPLPLLMQWIHYKPRPYKGHVVLFATSANPVGNLDEHDARLAWQRYVQEDMEVHIVPGSHLEMALEPLVVRRVARLLRYSLQQARVRGVGSEGRVHRHRRSHAPRVCAAERTSTPA